MNWINGRLACGAAIEPGDVDEYIRQGITHVIDCRAEFDDTAEFSEKGVSVLWLGVCDDGQPKPVEWFQHGIEFALDALSHPKNKLDGHCAAGVNRGPSMVYGILRAMGFSGDVAMQLLKTARPQVGVAYRADADRAVQILGYV